MSKDEQIAKLRAALERAQTILSNMALENEGAIFNRWPINHEPLRNDARGVLPVIAEALASVPLPGQAILDEVFPSPANKGVRMGEGNDNA